MMTPGRYGAIVRNVMPAAPYRVGGKPGRPPFNHRLNLGGASLQSDKMSTLEQPWNKGREHISTEELIQRLVEFASEATSRAGFVFHLERSHPTEAVYLRVHRGGHWFGLRIAAHTPAYECSADFAQLFVPSFDVSDEWIREALRQVEAFVQSGGRVVADPAEVQEAIERAFMESSSERHRFPSTSQVCAIRHRLNFRARWTFDEEQALSPSSDKKSSLGD